MTAFSTPVFFIGRSFDAFQVSVVVLKSLVVQFVNSNELGRLYSVVSVIETVSLSAFKSLYNNVNIETAEKGWPVAYLCITMITLIVMILSFM